jgi:hypothetical protein
MWKILQIQADGDLITGARYFCAKNGVETEGWWSFAEPVLNIPFADVTEEIVIAWVTKDIGAQVESRLDEQAANRSRTVVAPWLPQVFTPSI